MSISDQKQYWNTKHGTGYHRGILRKESSFAAEVEPLLKRQSYLLDLGCGIGFDSLFFAQNGHKVIATDFAEVVIDENKKLYEDKVNVHFEVLDMSVPPFRFKDSQFDTIYAHLSLHYFTDKITRKIIQELCRILKSGGLLCFACKSIHDDFYGKGTQVEANMFELNGHVRHLFSEEYVTSLLENKFRIEKIETIDEVLINKPSSYVKVVARKI